MYQTWCLMSVMVQACFDISPVIMDRFSASDDEAAFATAADGPSSKVILDWETF